MKPTNSAASPNSSTTTDATSSPVFVAGTPKKSNITTKAKSASKYDIKNAPLRVSSRLKLKKLDDAQGHSTPMLRRSGRNMNNSVEYIDEYPSEASASDTDTVTADSEIPEHSEETHEDKHEKKSGKKILKSQAPLISTGGKVAEASILKGKIYPTRLSQKKLESAAHD